MVIRYEYKCPECEEEFFTSEIHPTCPVCGFTVLDEEGEENG